MNYEGMGGIDKIIFTLFSNRWSGDVANAGIERMRQQLHENLTDQVNGYWSGNTAYHIMVDGGFLKDAKSGKKKELTMLGESFMESMKDVN